MEPTRTALLFTVDVSTWTSLQVRQLEQAVADIDRATSPDRVRKTDRVHEIEQFRDTDPIGTADPAGYSKDRTAPPAADQSWVSPNLQTEVDRELDEATAGWRSRTALEELIMRLQAGGYDTQAWAMRTCLDRGGTIRRSEILERLGKDADATLRGWTRPLNRIVDEMRSGGSVSRSAALPIAPQFTGEDGRADYFVAPQPLVRLWFQMGQPDDGSRWGHPRTAWDR